MRILVYKRTHKGDPNEQGLFGIRDCMGKVRRRDFDAVIGIGGIGSEPKAAGIDGKLTWVGIGAHKEPLAGARGPLVWFDRFYLWDDNGSDFSRIAPVLAKHIYSKGVRVLSTFNEVEQKEVQSILDMAPTDSSAPGLMPQKIAQYCPKCCQKSRKSETR